MKPHATTALVALAALLLHGAAAQAQRAASTPSAEGAEAAAPAPPAPPGFPAPLGNDIVYGGELQTHLEGDAAIVTKQPTRVSVFNDTDLQGFVNYKSWASLNAEAKLERNRFDNLDSYYPDSNAFFRSEGLTLRQLYTTIRPVEGLAVYGGKIHPNFASAYDDEPGQFYNFGTDYEQDERIGFGIQYELPFRGPPLLGLDSLRVTAETFFLDTSVLSNSLFSRPGSDDPTATRLRRNFRFQLGPSNTGSFDSGTVSLRGGRDERGLKWQVSATREGTNDPTARPEYGVSVSASYDPSGDGIPITSRLGVTPFFEYTHFNNYLNVKGLERNYAIGGLAFTYARYIVNVAGGLRNSAGPARENDHQENVSFTYELIPRLLVGGGVNFVNIGGRESRVIAPSLSYTRAF